MRRRLKCKVVRVMNFYVLCFTTEHRLHKLQQDESSRQKNDKLKSIMTEQAGQAGWLARVFWHSREKKTSGNHNLSL